jgi:hypothetical protein
MAGKSTYSQDKADAICEMLMEGRSLREIVDMKDMPAMSTVLKWLRENSSFSSQYAHAREAQAELMGDKMVELALHPPKGQDPQMLRVQMDAIKWAAGKIKPAKYGEANLLRKRADLEFEREMIDITPQEAEERPPMDRKQFARVMWYLLNAPAEEVEKLVEGEET